MRIGIIGRGRVGSALQSGWARAGHDVRTAGRDADPGAGTGAIADWAEVLVLAVPFAALDAVVADLGPVAGKLIIDCTNPVAMGADGLTLSLGHTTSGGERLQSLLPDARVVKTLNQVGAEVMADTSGFAHPPVQLLAGDDAAARQTVAGLLSDLGFEPLDAGGLSRARLLEPFALVWINQAMAQGRGRDWAFSALPRKADA